MGGSVVAFWGYKKACGGHVGTVEGGGEGGCEACEQLSGGHHVMSCHHVMSYEQLSGGQMGGVQGVCRCYGSQVRGHVGV